MGLKCGGSVQESFKGGAIHQNFLVEMDESSGSVPAFWEFVRLQFPGFYKNLVKSP